jgi:hypothetical protein
VVRAAEILLGNVTAARAFCSLRQLKQISGQTGT